MPVPSPPLTGKHGNSNDPIPNQQAMWHVEEEEEEEEEEEGEEEEEEEEEERRKVNLLTSNE